MKRLFLTITIILGISIFLRAQVAQVPSPDERLVLVVEVNNGLYYSVYKDGNEIIQRSRIDLTTNRFNTSIFGPSTTASRITHNVQVLRPVWGTSAKITNEYKQLTLQANDEVSIEFRAFNDGVAWRFITSIDGEIIVEGESTDFKLPSGTTVYYPETKKFLTPFEPNYPPIKIEAINAKSLAHTPIMFKLPQDQVVVISESDLYEYPGMFLEKSDQNTFRTVFPKYPKRESQELLGRLRLVKWPQLSRMVVRSTENYIAKSGGERNFPWRVIMVADADRDILSNNLVYQLADYPQRDYSWVKPGKVVWDWYHNWNLQGVDFKAGINTQTYKFMIDFAAQNGIEYVNIDDGWSKLWNFDKINSKLDLDEVLGYAREKNVGIFLWAMWNTLDKDLISNLDWFQQMGIAGIKVDFFDRCDQRMVDFINLLAEECAKRNLLLNLHGMYKPTGISRTFPNVVNIEAVLGLEYNKFSDKCTPEHNLTIPFVRNIVGPMDYTPGAMRYMAQADFKKSWKNPHAMSTRAQQMAMFIVYHGGVQMLADSPTFYEQDDIALSFLSEVPVTWDETIPLVGKIGEAIVIARRKGNKWYVGGMAGEKNQTVMLNLNFLGDRQYQMTLLIDGSNPYDLVKEEKAATGNDIFMYEISAAGGFVMIFE